MTSLSSLLVNDCGTRNLSMSGIWARLSVPPRMKKIKNATGSANAATMCFVFILMDQKCVLLVSSITPHFQQKWKNKKPVGVSVFCLHFNGSKVCSFSFVYY